MLTIDAAIHDAVMALPPDERRDRAKAGANEKEVASLRDWANAALKKINSNGREACQVSAKSEAPSASPS